MTTATSFTPTPIALIRPDGSRQSFPSLRDAAMHLDSLTVANGGIARPPSVYVPNISKAARTGRLAYGCLWVRLEATPI